MTAWHGVGTRWITRAAACAIGVAGVALATSSALADQYLDQANKAASATPGTKPAQDILMPALATMTEPPVPTGWTRDELLTLLLAAPGEDDWKALETWAAAEPQQAALKALETITTGDDRYILGFPYGKDAVPPEWASADLYVGLNDEGLLFSATFPYGDRIGWLVGLASFEAARAASAGDGDRAVAMCLHMVKLGRIITERAFLRETIIGLSVMFTGLERMRDVMYQFESAFNPKVIKDAAEELNRLRVREITLPIANRLAAEQIVARTFQERGGVDAPKLAEVMGGARVQGRTLQRLSEAAYWSDRAPAQADWFDVTDKIKGVWADWEARWRLTDLYDPLFDVPSEFRKMDPNKYLPVFYTMLGIDGMFQARLQLLTEIGGTMNAIGCVGFRQTNKTLPPQLASVEPRFVARLSPDLYNVDRRQPVRKYQPFQYWVPIRDQKWDRRETPHPYEIIVTMIRGGGAVGLARQDIGEEIVDILYLKLLGSAAARPDQGVINAEALTIDAARYRQHLQNLAENHKWTSSELNAMNALLRSYAWSATTSENFEERYDAWFAENGAKTREIAERVGIEMDAFTSMVKDVVRALLDNETIKQNIRNAKDGTSISEENAKKITAVYIDTVVQPEKINGLLTIMSAFREQAKRQLEAAGGPGLPTTVFNAEVDDTQFLLYSVYENGVDDRARLVGDEGIDLLMWPPILSLQRQAR